MARAYIGSIRELNIKLDQLWSKYNREFPGLFYTDDQGRKSMPLVVPGAALRSDHAPIYLRRLVDQDPQSWYMLLAADPTKGYDECSHAKAVEFFHDFFYTQMGMPSSYDRESGMRPSREHPDFGTMDEWQACAKEVLPSADQADAKFDELTSGNAASSVETADDHEARRQQFMDKTGIDIDDPDIIDIGEPPTATPAAAPTSGRTDITEYAGGSKYDISFLNKICYVVDFHVPSVGTEIGYDRGAHAVGHRGRASRQLRESSDQGLTVQEASAKIHQLIVDNPWNAVKADNIMLGIAENSMRKTGISYQVDGISLDGTTLELTSAGPSGVVVTPVSLALIYDMLEEQNMKFTDITAIRFVDGRTGNEFGNLVDVDSATADPDNKKSFDGILFVVGEAASDKRSEADEFFEDEKPEEEIKEGLMDDIWNGTADRDSGAEEEDYEERGHGNYDADDRKVRVSGIGEVSAGDITPEDYDEMVEDGTFRGRSIPRPQLKLLISMYRSLENDGVRAADPEEEIPEIDDEENPFIDEGSVLDRMWNGEDRDSRAEREPEEEDPYEDPEYDDALRAGKVSKDDIRRNRIDRHIRALGSVQKGKEKQYYKDAREGLYESFSKDQINYWNSLICDNR